MEYAFTNKQVAAFAAPETEGKDLIVVERKIQYFADRGIILSTELKAESDKFIQELEAKGAFFPGRRQRPHSERSRRHYDEVEAALGCIAWKLSKAGFSTKALDAVCSELRNEFERSSNFFDSLISPEVKTAHPANVQIAYYPELDYARCRPEPTDLATDEIEFDCLILRFSLRRYLSGLRDGLASLPAT